MKRCLILLIILVVPTSTFAADVVGRVALQRHGTTTPTVDHYLGRETTASGSEYVSPVISHAIVYLTSATKKSFPPPVTHPDMEQRDQTFVPDLLPILVGTTVDFPNSDPIFHNVFSYSKSKKFDLGRYGKGESKSVTFDKAGLIKVFCEIHPSMRAFILVLDQPYFTVTDEAGNFWITNVPPGEYELSVWQEQLSELKKKIVVPQSDSLLVNMN